MYQCTVYTGKGRYQLILSQRWVLPAIAHVPVYCVLVTAWESGTLSAGSVPALGAASHDSCPSVLCTVGDVISWSSPSVGCCQPWFMCQCTVYTGQGLYQLVLSQRRALPWHCWRWWKQWLMSFIGDTISRYSCNSFSNHLQGGNR